MNPCNQKTKRKQRQIWGWGELTEADDLESGEPDSKCQITGNNRVNKGLHIWPLKMYGKDHMQTWGNAYDKMVKK